jgi:hypothetical protein
MELYPKYPKETLFALIKTARHRLTISNLSFYELTDSAPLAFIEKGGSRTALPVLFDSSGSSVDLSDHSEGGTVVVNVLCWPQFKAFIDGREAGLDTDEWNRCVVAAPPRSRTLRCEFSPEWNGVFSSTILVLAAALLSFILISSRSGT